MKNTAVYWLIKEYSKYIGDIDVPIEVLKKANEMEKKQIMDAWIEGGEYRYLSQESDRLLAEQYYNETVYTNEK